MVACRLAERASGRRDMARAWQNKPVPVRHGRLGGRTTSHRQASQDPQRSEA
jgi:hypothetical protein